MPSARLWFHGLAAAAIGGAITALSNVFLRPADLRLDAASLHHYAATAAGGAVIAVLAYFKQSPVQPSQPPLSPQTGELPPSPHLS